MYLQKSLFIFVILLFFSIRTKPDNNTERLENLEKAVAKIILHIQENQAKEDSIKINNNSNFEITEPAQKINQNCKPKDLIYRKFPQQFPRSFEILLSFLENPVFLKDISIKIPNKFLFYGPPGCGKSYLAEMLSREFQVPMIYIKASDLEDRYYGESSKKITELFKTRDAKGRPLIIFIDEIDAIASQRNDAMGEGRRASINALLVELQKCSYDSSVVVIVATNDKEALDKAILNRFEGFCVEIKPMNNFERELFLQDLLRDLPIQNSSSVIKKLAQCTNKLSRRAISGAIESANVWSYYKLIDGKRIITLDDLMIFMDQANKDATVPSHVSLKRMIQNITPYLNVTHTSLGICLTFIQLIRHPWIVDQINKII